MAVIPAAAEAIARRPAQSSSSVSSRVPGRDCARLLLQILRMPQRRPPKAELADIAEHIVAGGHGAVLDPGNQIVEGGLAHRVLDAAMPGRANSALDRRRKVPALSARRR